MPSFKALSGGKSLAVAGTALVLVAVGAAVYVVARTPSSALGSGDTTGEWNVGGSSPTATSPSPSRSASAPPKVPAPSRGASASPVAPAAAGDWPSPSNTGVPAGWAPASTRTSDLRVTTEGAVVAHTGQPDDGIGADRGRNTAQMRGQYVGGRRSLPFGEGEQRGAAQINRALRHGQQTPQRRDGRVALSITVMVVAALGDSNDRPATSAQ